VTLDTAIIPEVLTYPDRKLERATQCVGNITEHVLDVAANLMLTEKDSNARGVAANQLGYNLRMCTAHGKVYVNPEIMKREGETTEPEGCLSLPGIVEKVVRASKIKVRYRDLEDKEHVEEIEGELSRTLQHECDHLSGMLLIDRMTPAQFRKHLPVLRYLEANSHAKKKA